MCSMSEAGKPTPGAWEIKPIEDGKEYIRIRGTMLGSRFKIANVLMPNYGPGTKWQERDDAEAQANARLIAEAGTVHHEIGLTPRQLLEQRDSLLKQLQAATDALSGGLWDYGPGQDEHECCNEVIAECRAALALVKGETK